MVKGLKEVNQKLEEKNIPMYLLQGEPQDSVPELARKLQARAGG